MNDQVNAEPGGVSLFHKLIDVALKIHADTEPDEETLQLAEAVLREYSIFMNNDLVQMVNLHDGIVKKVEKIKCRQEAQKSEPKENVN
jgi:hypothetical protein